MSFLEAIILGIIQGLTEFLPISSSGHLQLASIILGVSSVDSLLFTTIAHGATICSTMIVFNKEIIEIIKKLFQFQLNKETKLVISILISTIPVFIVGVFFKSQIQWIFNGQLIFLASMFMITGLLLLASQYLATKNPSKEISYKKSIIIGLAQAFAILPGVSRSGATISTALILGVDKKKATQFSFLMIIPPILGATLLEVKEIVSRPIASTQISTEILLTGFFVALIVGIFACQWMINIVKKGNLIYFSYYCFFIATLCLLALLL